MKITYDKTVDALNLTFKKGTVAKTLELSEGVLLDVDKNGTILYIEVLNASEIMSKENLKQVRLGKTSFSIPVLA